MTSLSEFTNIQNSLILVDANIIIKYATADFDLRSGYFLETLGKAESANKLFLCAYTLYEILYHKKLSGRGVAYGDIEESISEFDVLPLDKSAVHNLGHLKKCYKKVYGGAEVSNSSGDLTLAATALTLHYTPAINRSVYIATCDRKDFKEPFWSTAIHHHVPETNDNPGSAVNLYLLEINNILLDKYITKEI